MSAFKFPSAQQILSAATSFAGSGMLIRTFAKDLLAADPCEYLATNILPVLLSETKIIIEEFRGLNKNQLFDAVETYLGTKLNPNTRRFKVGQNKNEKKLSVTIDKSLTISDSFEGAKFTWCLLCQPVQPVVTYGNKAHQRDINSILKSEVRSYELTFHQSYRGVVLDSYLSYIMRRSEEIKEEDKAAKLHTVDYRRWTSTPINLGHPMTFATLALDDELKMMIMEDLDNFACGKDYYRKIGKAWKRGYLLFGPPGTGKSSLVAAMANYLNYDIFDLDLTECECNSDLKALLLSMSNRSILVLEDIDCTIKQINREKENSKNKDDEASKVTLSGLLNFIDGLWSCCGEERIIIFTTNHKDKLDPALLRPGRMDMHIHMSYCTFSAFKQLALNCLEFVHHELFDRIEELIAKIEVTPAEVAGELMKSPDREVSIRRLVKFLEDKIEEKEANKKDEASDKKVAVEEVKEAGDKKDIEQENENDSSIEKDESEKEEKSERVVETTKEEEKIDNASQKEEEKIDNVIHKEEEKINNTSQKEEENIDNTSQKEEEKIDNVSQKEEEKIDNVSQKEHEKIDNASQKDEEKGENASQNYQKEEDDGEIVEEEEEEEDGEEEQNEDGIEKKEKIGREDVLGYALDCFILTIIILWGILSGFAYFFGFLKFA